MRSWYFESFTGPHQGASGNERLSRSQRAARAVSMVSVARWCIQGRHKDVIERRPAMARSTITVKVDGSPIRTRSNRGCCSCTTCVTARQGRHGGRLRHQQLRRLHRAPRRLSVKSCTVLAVQADGGEVTTIEGLAAPTAAAPVQKAFHENHAPAVRLLHPRHDHGAVDLLAREPDPDEAEIREGLEGNLCRCTGLPEHREGGAGRGPPTPRDRWHRADDRSTEPIGGGAR